MTKQYQRKINVKIKRFRFYSPLNHFYQEISVLMYMKHIRFEMKNDRFGVAPYTSKLLTMVSNNVLKTAGLPKKFWINSMHYAMHTLNRVIHQDFKIIR